MTYLDIIFAIPLAWFAFKGFTKGFIAELAMLAALLLGIYLSISFSQKVGEFIGVDGEYAEIVSFIITFLIVVIFVYLIGKWVENIASTLSLGFFNNLLGALFGILKVAFIISVCIYFVNSLDKHEVIFKREVKNKSLLYQPIERIAPLVFKKLEESKSNTK